MLKYEICYFMNNLGVLYNNGNGPVKNKMIGHSTLLLGRPTSYNKLTTPVKTYKAGISKSLNRYFIY